MINEDAQYQKRKHRIEQNFPKAKIFDTPPTRKMKVTTEIYIQIYKLFVQNYHSTVQDF